jgi:hypothetical protein
MFGVKFDASIGVDLKIQGWNGDKDKPFFEKDLWNAPDLYKFPNVCIPFEFGTKSPISVTTSAIHYTTPPVPTTSLPVHGYGYGNGEPEDHTKGYRPRGRLARHLV